ncbi:MAG: hypothetical protein PVH62_03675 [Anaerolineae bacterium]
MTEEVVLIVDGAMVLKAIGQPRNRDRHRGGLQTCGGRAVTGGAFDR